MSKAIEMRGRPLGFAEAGGRALSRRDPEKCDDGRLRPLLPLPAPHARRLSPGRGAGAGAAGWLGGPRCTPLLGACRSATCGRHRGLGGAHCGTQPWPRWASGRAGRGQLGFLLVRAGHWPVRPDPPTGVSPARRVPVDAGHGCSWCQRRHLPRPPPASLTPWDLFPERAGGGGGRGPRPFLLVLREPVACRAQGRPRGSHCTAREGPAAGWSCATATCDPCRSQPFSKPRRGPEGPAGARAVCVWGGALPTPGQGSLSDQRKVSLETWRVPGYSFRTFQSGSYAKRLCGDRAPAPEVPVIHQGGQNLVRGGEPVRADGSVRGKLRRRAAGTARRVC